MSHLIKNEDNNFEVKYTKITQSGDLLVLKEYEKEPLPPRHRTSRKRNPYKKMFKSERHIQRSKNNFRNKVRATLIEGTPHLVTLTMLDIVNIEVAYKHYTEFGSRLRKVFGKEIIWIAVPEFQKRDAVHFHVLMWNLPYDVHETETRSRRIQNLWGYGYVDVIATDGSPKLSSYLAKYMSKAMHDYRLFSKKAYSCSRNAVSSVSVSSQTSVAFFRKEFDFANRKPSRERVYKTRWLGRVREREYDGTIE